MFSNFKKRKKENKNKKKEGRKKSFDGREEKGLKRLRVSPGQKQLRILEKLSRVVVERMLKVETS